MTDWQQEDLINRFPLDAERAELQRRIRDRERRDAVLLGITVGIGIAVSLAAAWGVW